MNKHQTAVYLKTKGGCKKNLNLFLILIYLLNILFLFFMIPDTAGAARSVAVNRAAVSEKYMALTFDAGSDAGHTAKILDILAKYNIKSTFFLTGEYTNLHPDLANKILKQGHEIGNHSYSHPRFTQIPSAAMQEELNKAHQEILRVTGKAPEPLFRPPTAVITKKYCKLSEMPVIFGRLCGQLIQLIGKVFHLMPLLKKW